MRASRGQAPGLCWWDSDDYVRGFVLRVGGAVRGSSGQGGFGYRPRHA